MVYSFQYIQGCQGVCIVGKCGLQFPVYSELSGCVYCRQVWFTVSSTFRAVRVCVYCRQVRFTVSSIF